MFIDTFMYGGIEANPVVSIDGQESYISDPGYFLADEMVLSPAIPVDELYIGRCIVDKLYIERNTDTDVPTWDGAFPTSWDWDTAMMAEFNGNLNAGSVDYSVETVTELRIKRRVYGEEKWKTIYVRPISAAEDFKFSYYDYLNASGTKYEYSVVPLINGFEGAIDKKLVESSFEDYYLLDSDLTVYHIILDVQNNVTYNMEGAAQTTIAKKYPFIIQNGYVGYYSGTLDATFAEMVNCKLDTDGGVAYRRKVDEFLANKKAKILKDWMGNIYLISIFESFSIDGSDLPYLPKYSINWTECGGADNVGDLYDNNFINTQIDRE